MNTPSSTCRVVYSFDSAPDDGTLDDDGHGSNVSAIVSKVATKTKIIGIDVFRKVRSQGKWVSTAYDSDILAGINWAVNNAQTYNIKAVNLSLGVPESNIPLSVAIAVMEQHLPMRELLAWFRCSLW